MNYTKAKLIIWNPDAYSRAQVKDAAIYILGTMCAASEDLDQASLLL